jgi:hypothetical protein
LRTSKKYFSFVLLNQEENVRALWGLKYTCLALKDAGEDESAAATTDKLLSLVEEKTKAAYNHLKTKDYIQ